MTAIALLVSLDTKAEEAVFLRDAILAAGGQVLLVDFGTNPAAIVPDVDAATLAGFGGVALETLRDKP